MVQPNGRWVSICECAIVLTDKIMSNTATEALPFFERDHTELRAHIRTWLEQTRLLESTGRTLDQQARVIAARLGGGGFFAHVLPQAWGGKRAIVSARDLCVLREELARCDALVDTMFAVQALGSYPITIAGSEKQKAHYLPPFGRGTRIPAFALTEPEAGSDVSSLQTVAVKRGNHYSLSGTKHFISNAGIADTYVVFASSDPVQKGKGISAFIVDADASGLSIEKTTVMSPHPIGTLRFDDCRVPEDLLLGKEGDGLKIAFETLDLLRCTVGAAAAGFAQRALEAALAYSASRRQFGKTLNEFQGTQFKFAEMATDLEAARLLVYRAAWAHDDGAAEARKYASMAKLFATEAAQKIIDQALQIHGGSGVVVGSITEKLYRDIRALRIYEGTSEIQKLVIARELLKRQ
jgi:acyl-CoA dehydrogenase